MRPHVLVSLALLASIAPACGNDAGSPGASEASTGSRDGTGGTDRAAAGSGGVASVGGLGAVSGGTGGAAAAGGGGESSGAGAVNGGAAGSARVPGPLTEHGFVIGLPRVHSLTCVGDLLGAPREVPDADWLCTFSHDQASGYLYVQATPVACAYRYTISTTFVTRGWLSIDGAVSELDHVDYDWGDFHHIDTLTFIWNELEFTYGHSSLLDSRICAPMDCLVIRASDGEMQEDGCTQARTHPIVCVPILEDGTHDELVDTFEGCRT